MNIKKIQLSEQQFKYTHEGANLIMCDYGGYVKGPSSNGIGSIVNYGYGYGVTWGRGSGNGNGFGCGVGISGISVNEY